MSTSVLKQHWYDCEHPKLVRNRYTGELIQVPCGKCHCCRVSKMQRWVAPLAREASQWKYVFFFTLTYSEKFLPRFDILNYVPKKEQKERYNELVFASKDYLELVEYMLPFCPTKDIQLFLKRLREIIYRKIGQRSTFRYFISSDYGSTLFRPHWHGIIFTNNDYVASNMSSFVFNSWSLLHKASGKRYSLGRIECEPAISAGRYVSSYIQAIDHLPAIYDFPLFKTKSLHSCNPPLGFNIRPLESMQQIVEGGLSSVTLYNPTTYEYTKTPLQSSVVRRLFPAIPSFSSLSRAERLEIYRYVYDRIDLTPKERRRDFLRLFRVNSFFRDYISLNNEGLTIRHLYDKFDRLYYAFVRLLLQSQLFDTTVAEYDSLVFNFFQKRYFNALFKQFSFESLLIERGFSNVEIDSIIDIGRSENERHVPSFSPTDVSVIPLSVDSEFFAQKASQFNRFVKRKCDNAYLELHPEFKKFHQ